MPNPLFKTAEEFKDKINAYFKRMDKEKKPYTMAGLALSCGCSVEKLFSYIKKSDDLGYYETMLFAKLRIQDMLETELVRPTAKNSMGVIATMNNYFGFTNKSTVNNTHTFTQMPTIKMDGEELTFDVGEEIKKGDVE